MKTILTSAFTATLLDFASRFSGRSFELIDFTAILFASVLVAWTIEQYSREPRLLTVGRPIRFPVNLAPSRAKNSAPRLAA